MLCVGWVYYLFLDLLCFQLYLGGLPAVLIRCWTVGLLWFVVFVVYVSLLLYVHCHSSLLYGITLTFRVLD